jgi:ATP-dependent Lhr-like helicase
MEDDLPSGGFALESAAISTQAPTWLDPRAPDPLELMHPAVRDWFRAEIGEPSAPQRRGWPVIGAGKHTLIAAPTGSGKTLAAFLHAISALYQEGAGLRDRTQVLYVSPLKALSNDIQKNLQGPLAAIQDREFFLPEIRVAVRTGDTPSTERARMLRKPPHILVTTPESLYLLLTSASGQQALKTIKTVIVDEIHALAPSKRGSHLVLSLERLEALAGRFQRIGLSATQKPIEEIACFLGGVGRQVEIVDTGHLRDLDLGVEIPPAPLTAVCSHETWSDLYARMAVLVQEHRTTLIFSNTRRLAERLAARLSDRLGTALVGCHHGSMSKERRLSVEDGLKSGRLRVVVATASLELGLDIGEIDLVLQIGSPRAISTFVQRVGRAGHGLGRVPKGRLFPLTLDELVECAALLRAVRAGKMDRLILPDKPLDILAQQLVAACAENAWSEDELYETLTRAWTYRNTTRAEFDQCVRLHAQGRHALLHRDGVNRRLRGSKAARRIALMNGGAIAGDTDYTVVMDPGGLMVGRPGPAALPALLAGGSAGPHARIIRGSWSPARGCRGRGMARASLRPRGTRRQANSGLPGRRTPRPGSRTQSPPHHRRTLLR